MFNFLKTATVSQSGNTNDPINTIIQNGQHDNPKIMQCC